MHNRKAAVFLVLLAFAFFCRSSGMAAPQPDQPRVQIWRDATDGLAIGGYDPVAYWTIGGPRKGRNELEFGWAGAFWRFLNPGNRDAFVRHPDAYSPRYGGHDVTALAAGVVVQGHPGIWAIHDNRLLLFANAVNRRLWEEDSEVVMARAAKAWPEMSRSVPPYDPAAVAQVLQPSRHPAFAIQLLPGLRDQAMKPGLLNSRDALP